MVFVRHTASLLVNEDHADPIDPSLLRQQGESLARKPPAKPEFDSAETLAALSDGMIELSDLTAEEIDRTAEQAGAKAVVDAALSTSALAGIRGPLTQIENTPDGHLLPFPGSRQQSTAASTLPRVFRFPTTWMGLAAVIAIGLFVGMWSIRRPSEVPGETRDNPSTQVALGWPSLNAIDPSGRTDWAARAPRLPAELPQFDRITGTLGASEDRYVDWRLATVIVRTGDGFGSGAFVSADGWIITNYHVIARAAQSAALAGTPAKATIIVGQIADGRVRPAADQIPATVYRADPEHDLALLKLDRVPGGGIKAFALAREVMEGADCYVIGSQNNGPAWWIRAGNVTHIFDFPSDLSQVAAGVSEPRVSIDRNRATVLVTDTRISQGDSGGPLLNAQGELIGITFATPANLTGGSIGWHIALEHIRPFLANLPDRPESVPFDLWTFGNPDSSLLEPEFLDPDNDGSQDALVYHYTVDDAEGRPSPYGAVAFVSLQPLTQASGTAKANPLDLVPYGLWGVGSEGRFHFDVVMASRADDVRVLGYIGTDGILDEIRLGAGESENTSVRWKRELNGTWLSTRPATAMPLIDPNRIGPEQIRHLKLIIDNLNGDRSGNGKATEEQSRGRGPNKM